MAIVSFHNELVFLLHLVTIAVGSIAAAKIGRRALIAFACLIGVLSNLLVSKQILLFGMNVTATDLFAVGALFCLNLIQEFYGKTAARKAITISFFCMLSYIVLTQLHLSYLPSPLDTMHERFQAILGIMPRLAGASITVYAGVQYFDTFFYGLLKKLCNDRFVALRGALALAVSQLLDTVLFAFLGLYGIVHSVIDVIIVSYVVKLAAILLLAPFMKCAKILLDRK